MTNSKYIQGSGGGGCFTGDTPVSIPGGSKPIKQINVGDIVCSFDDKGTIYHAKVLKVHEHENEPVVKYTIWGGKTLDATPNHWVLNQFNAFVGIDTLGTDDCLVDEFGHLRPIIERKAIGTHTVYNLTVEGHHTFIANTIRVHNAGLGPNIAGAGGGGKKEVEVVLRLLLQITYIVSSLLLYLILFPKVKLKGFQVHQKKVELKELLHILMLQRKIFF